MRILVTGGAGFIGSNLARRLESATGVSDLLLLDDFSTGHRRNLHGISADCQNGSILDQTALDRAVKNRDAIVHLAAIPSVPRSIAYPVASHEANATGTLAVLEAARRASVDHVIVASSSSVYGSNPSLPKRETDWTRPMSPYAVSKQATEAYAIAYQHAYGLKTLALRFFNVYGPAQAPDHAYAAVIPKFLYAALAGNPVTINGDGTQTRDFTFVDTVTDVITDALFRAVHDQHPVNLAYGNRTSLLELLDILEELLHQPIDRIFTEARKGDVRASQASGERIAALFPDIQPTTLRDGLHKTIDWFRSRANS